MQGMRHQWHRQLVGSIAVDADTAMTEGGVTMHG